MRFGRVSPLQVFKFTHARGQYRTGNQMEDKFYPYLKMYKKAPEWFKRVVGGIYSLFPYSVRYGKVYKHFTKLLNMSKYWTREEHEAYQLIKLRETINRAYYHVPFYRKKFEMAKVKPEDLKSLEDINKFPFTTREEIKENLDKFLADDIPPSERLYVTTSGTSGIPLEFYLQKGVTRPKERAFVIDMWKTIDYKIGDKCVVFRGEVIQSRKRPWYYDPIDHQLIMSSYFLSEEYLKSYCNKIRQFRPHFLRGYPFTIFKLVQLMKTRQEIPFALKGVILESENVYEEHKKIIGEFFDCPVYHSYGHSERLVIGGICKYSEKYHLYPEYGFTEVISSNGTHAKIGEEGEIVATGFDNMVMPLIRYRTQDIAVWGGWVLCQCGRNVPMLERIVGRTEEYVYFCLLYTSPSPRD